MTADGRRGAGSTADGVAVGRTTDGGPAPRFLYSFWDRDFSNCDRNCTAVENGNADYPDAGGASAGGSGSEAE